MIHHESADWKSKPTTEDSTLLAGCGKTTMGTPERQWSARMAQHKNNPQDAQKGRSARRGVRFGTLSL